MRIAHGVVIAALACSAVACGKGGSSATAKKDDAGSGAPAVAPLAMPVLGVDEPRRMNYVYDVGAPAFEKAVVAYKAKTRDWAAVRAACETAIAKDPMHFDAHVLLATALAQQGEHAAAVDHLVTALAGDYYRYSASLPKDDNLKDFFATPHGQAVTALAARIGAEYGKRTAAGVWVLARRAAFKWPAGVGAQPATTRGELYAYDRESRRYLRLTHTDHEVAGVIRSAGGGELAVIGFDRVNRPADKADKKKADDSAAPLLERPWVSIIDTATWQPAGPRVAVPAAREVSVGYAAGDDLRVTTEAATGRWSLDAPVVYSVDKPSGKLTKVTSPVPPTRIALTLDEGRLVEAGTGVDAAWTGDPPAATALETNAGATMTIPDGSQATQASIDVSPGGAHVAFVTAADPCAKDAAPSLYVADAKTGAFKHVLSTKSRFATRWLDGNELAYEDGTGAIRLWDASTGREVAKLDDKAGLALDVLSGTPEPICKQAPPAIEHAGSDEPLPPEQPGTDGSAVTQPTP